MFSKQRSGPRLVEGSPISHLYEIGAQVTATGPEPDPPVWKIYDAIDRQNGKEVSIHVYEKRGGERVGRGRRKEGIAELLKTGVTKLQHYSNPWLLDIVQGAVENTDCVVFVSEHVLGTLSTVLSSQQPRDQHGQGSRSNSLESNCTYSLIDFEFRWGLSQCNDFSDCLAHSYLREERTGWGPRDYTFTIFPT